MLEVTARSAADLLVIQPNSAILFYRKIREVNLALEADEVFDGQIELDESYFDGTRKGKRGRGAVGKTAVFGLLKCDGKVYTVVVPNIQSATLLPIFIEAMMFLM
ncbi:IS1016C2 transposase, family IS1595 [Glaesserella parasuis]|nr:IS1016C2 transposase, family IS1595 [Glaesserella parasuis]